MFDGQSGRHNQMEIISCRWDTLLLVHQLMEPLLRSLAGLGMDGPNAGSSSYADNEVGACGTTGNGDIMMRFLPYYQVVESTRLGMEPELATKDAISRIARKYPNFVGAVFAINKQGLHAGACRGWTFQYSVRSPEMDDVEVFTVLP